MPRVEAVHIVEWLSQMAWCTNAGMGIGPLPATEVAAWARLAGVQIQPWEFALICAGSAAFVSQSSDDSPIAPYVDKAAPKPDAGSAFRSLTQKVNAK